MFRAESGRILATLIRLLGNFDMAEDAMHDAFNTEARDLNHAVELISQHPGAKLGPWRIRPAST